MHNWYTGCLEKTFTYFIYFAEDTSSRNIIIWVELENLQI